MHEQEFKTKVEWGIDLQTEHERWLTDEVCLHVVVRTEATIKGPHDRSIARDPSLLSTTRPRSSPSTCGIMKTDALWRPWTCSFVPHPFQLDRAERLQVPKVGELVGGSVREERLAVLKEKMARAGAVSACRPCTLGSRQCRAWRFLRLVHRSTPVRLRPARWLRHRLRALHPLCVRHTQHPRRRLISPLPRRMQPVAAFACGDRRKMSLGHNFSITPRANGRGPLLPAKRNSACSEARQEQGGHASQAHAVQCWLCRVRVC